MTDEQFKQLLDKLENLQRAIDAGRMVFVQPQPQPLYNPWNPGEPYNPYLPWNGGGVRD